MLRPIRITKRKSGNWVHPADLVSSEHINDLGVIVGRGDVPDSNGVLSNHTLIVPLFGPHAGEWYDLGTLGGAEPTGGKNPMVTSQTQGWLLVAPPIGDG